MEGAEFAAEVPEAARAGTRHNLQRPEVLDAERFPTILLQSTAVSGTHDNPVLLMRVTIKGVTRDVTALARVKEEGDRLIADGGLRWCFGRFISTLMHTAMRAMGIP